MHQAINFAPTLEKKTFLKKKKNSFKDSNKLKIFCPDDMTQNTFNYTFYF